MNELQRPRTAGRRLIGAPLKCHPVKASKPYVQSGYGHGAYVHRVRSAMHYQYSNSATGKDEVWVAAQCWCGNHLLISTRKGGRFLNEPAETDTVCATCEGRFVGTGQSSTPQINGRYVRYAPRI